MATKVRSADDARYNGRNDWERVNGALSMGSRVGGFVTTCPQCGKEYEASYAERAIHAGNATQPTPFHPKYDLLCAICVTEANEQGNVECPEPQGWEDRIVRWTPTNSYHGSEAYGEVLREDEQDCRGNLLVYLVAPEKLVSPISDGDRFLVMTYDGLELVAPEDEPTY